MAWFKKRKFPDVDEARPVGARLESVAERLERVTEELEKKLAEMRVTNEETK